MPRDQRDLNKFQEGLLITGAGGVGGLLSFTYTIASNGELAITNPWGWLAYIFLGMGAGFLGVYLVAKTDTSHITHAISFAIACGLSWAPIMNASTALIEEKTEISNQQTLENLKSKSYEIKNITQRTNPKHYIFLAEEIKELGLSVANIQPKIKSVEGSKIANETVAQLFEWTDIVQKDQKILANNVRKELINIISSSNLNSVAQINFARNNPAALSSIHLFNEEPQRYFSFDENIINNDLLNPL